MFQVPVFASAAPRLRAAGRLADQYRRRVAAASSAHMLRRGTKYLQRPHFFVGRRGGTARLPDFVSNIVI
jgi:hypothetical protein